LKYRSIIVFFVIFGFTKVGAQNLISLKGIVKDSTQILSNVNIIAKPIDKNIDIVFSITDARGTYKLELLKNKPYKITVSSLGYDRYIFHINANKDLEKNVILSQSTEQLDEVIIIEEIPMIVKKDTIIYDAKAFTNGSEYKLKNILEKLPGVEVEKNGEVLVNGKKVTKMLVEGDSFFGGSSKLAVENIPANAVDNVEVLDNYSAIGFLKDFVDSDEMAMNITLKEDRKRFVFGDIKSGFGEHKRYESHAGLFYYSPKTNINFIGDLNDTGKQSFTLSDYLSFEGGLSRIAEKDGSSKSNSIENYANLINTRPFLNKENRFAAVNITSNVNPNLSLSGYSIFSNNKTIGSQEVVSNYFFEQESYEENAQSDQEDDNLISISKITTDYSPSFREKLFFDFQVKIFNNQRAEKRYTNIDNLITNFTNEKDIGGIELTQDFEWHKKFTSKHTSSLVIKNQYSNTTPQNIWNTDRPIIQSLIPLIEEEQFNLVQNIDLSSHTFDIIAKHYWVLNSKNHLYSTVGNNYLNQKYSTEDFQRLEGGTINSFENAGFNNNLRFKLNDLYLGLHHKFKAGIFTVKTGGYLHYYHWKTGQLPNSSNDKLIFLPDVTTKLELSPSENVTFKYRFLSNFTDAPNYTRNYRLLDYNRVISGNPYLENEIYQNGNIRYSKFAMYNGLILNAILDYKRKNSFIRNEIRIEGIDQVLSPALLTTPESTLNTMVTIRKRIKKITAKFSARFQYSTFQKIIEEINSKDESYDYNIELSTKSRFKKLPNIELGFRSKFTTYDSGELRTDFVSYTPFGKIEYTFLKEFTFLFNYDFTQFNNNTSNTTTIFDVADISLFYKVNNSPLGFEISGSNLFNTQFKQKSISSDFLISNQKDVIIPRIVMLSLYYKL